MTPPPSGTPWWAWAMVVIAVAAIATIGPWLTSRPIRRRLDEQGSVVAQVREQVQNTHRSNLRDDVDGVGSKLDDVLAGQARLERGQRRHDNEIAGLREDGAQTRREVSALSDRVDTSTAEQRDRHTALTRRLEEHLAPPAT